MVIQPPTPGSSSTAGGGLPSNNIVPAPKPAGCTPSPFSDVIVYDRHNSAANLFKRLSGEWATAALLNSAYAGSYA